MEDLSAYMNVLFVMRQMRQMGDSFWMCAVILLLVPTVLVLIAAGIKDRSENKGKNADKGADINDGDLDDRNANEKGIVMMVIEALGGMDNIYSLACSDTRLRVTVNDGTLVNRARLKASGALGVLAKRRQVQIFYNEQVERICRELKEYIESHRCVEAEQEEIDYERVLKKVYVPVEGDVVRISDICCLQNLGDGSIGMCAVRAARGEIRAPFDCKAGYSKTGDCKIECVSEEGYIMGIYIVADVQRNWKHVRKSLNIRLLCDEGEYVRKGKLLAEYPYETFAEMGDMVYAVLELSVLENGLGEMICNEDDLDEYNGCEKNRQERCHLRVNAGENVNYEYVACEIVE